MTPIPDEPIDEAMRDPDYRPPAPEKPYLSSQIGCSEIAPLMIALGTDEGMPPRVRDWMKLARERAAFGRKSKKVPQHLKSPTFEGPVWCVDNAAKVATAVGPLPYCIATKAGVREKDAQEDYQKSGHDLESELWRRWVASLRDDGPLDIASLRSQFEPLAMYPPAWNVRAPSVRHPVEQRLVDYPDGWGMDVAGEPVVINPKTSRDWKDAPDVPALVQMLAEIAVTRSSLGVLVYGQRWTADFLGGDPWSRGDIKPFPVEPDAKAEAAILRTVDEAWKVIDDVRAKMSELKREVT